MGVYVYIMIGMELMYKNLKKNDPEQFRLYRQSQLKVFNRMLDSIERDIDKPMTREIYAEPDSPEVQLILTLYSMEPPIYAYI